MTRRLTVMIGAVLLCLGGPALAKDDRGAKAGKVQGKILKIKEVELKKGQGTHTVVLLQRQQGDNLVVDLGPTEQLKKGKAQIEEGKDLTAQGFIARIGNRGVLVAEMVDVDGNRMKVDRREMRKQRTQAMNRAKQQRQKQEKQQKQQQARRPGGAGESPVPSAQMGTGNAKTVQGKIARQKDVKIQSKRGQGTMHKVLLLTSPDAEDIVVDLGPVEQTRDLGLKEGATIVVTGRPSVVGDRMVLWADQISPLENTKEINR